MRNIILLGFASLFTDVASEMVYPLLPFFLTYSLGASPAILGLVEGIAETTASLLKVVSGHFSDRSRKRKRLTILGYSSSVAGRILLYAAPGWGMVLAGRVVDRLGKGIRTAPRDALIADSSAVGTRGTAFGLHRMMDTLGAAVGVVLAYLFLTRSGGDYRDVFLWSLVPAAIGVVLLFFVREGTHTSERVRQLPMFRWSILPRQLRVFLVIAAVFTLGNSSNTFLLLRATHLGYSPGGAVLLYLGYNIAYAVSSFPAGRLSDRIGRKTLLVTGYALYGMVYLLMGFVGSSETAWLIWLGFGLYGVYSALTEGIEKALVADLAPVEVRATAIGLHAAIVGAGLLPASLIAGLLWTHFGADTALFFGGGMGLIAATALFLLL